MDRTASKGPLQDHSPRQLWLEELQRYPRRTTEVDKAQIQPDSNVDNTKGVQTGNSKSVLIYQ